MADLAPHCNSQEALQQTINDLGPWFHNLTLNGVRTAPEHFLGDYPQVKYDTFKHVIPASLAGLTVLDIGCNAGFYSMEMKRRGAARVLGIDSDERYLRQARFAAGIEKLDIEFLHTEVWNIADLREQFDLVIFMGVLYHLRHPLLALDLIHRHVARDRLLFQSLQRGSHDITAVAEDYTFTAPAPFDEPGFPKLHFIEHRYSNDATNWWVPNRACTEAMLRSSGFSIEVHPEAEVYMCRKVPCRAASDGTYCVYPARGSS